MRNPNTNSSAQPVNTEPAKACRLLKGKVVHSAIETMLTNPHSGVQFRSYKPVCGKRPPKNSLTYGYEGTREAVNCGKCLAKRSE